MVETQVKNAAVESSLVTGVTAGGDINDAKLTETRLTAAAHLTSKVGGLRSVVSGSRDELGDLHQMTHDAEWRTAAGERGKASMESMLAELADLGFAWRDIARMVHVSVPAVQKWRRGEKASGESRIRVASLLAACDLIVRHYMVEEIASWFEMPLMSSIPVTPIILYAADRADLVFEFASGHVDPEKLLSEFDPDGRERYRSDFEIFEASDHNRSIRMKD